MYVSTRPRLAILLFYLRGIFVPVKSKVLRNLVHSKHLDLFGAILILVVCVDRDFHETYFQYGQIKFGIPISDIWSQMSAGAFPLGILSTIGAIFSLLSTRLIGKQNNAGNMIGVATTVNSGAIDYLFGNHSAIITYPVSFFLNSLSVFRWHKGESIRPRDLRYYLIFAGGLVFGTLLVYLGAWMFGGRADHAFLIVVSITFGLSIGGNFANAFKYEETWFSWFVYNLVQLVKNIMLLNIANIVKYLFYLFNSVITLLDWKWNGDILNPGMKEKPAPAL
jgi:nicotinamide mononucleotide transporter